MDDGTVPAQDEDAALRELPVAHAVALRLRAAGADDALIATALGVEIAGVSPILAVAEEKLHAALEPTTPARKGLTEAAP